MDGSVVAIFISPGAAQPMSSVDSVRAVPGNGLEGDRYFQSQGTFFQNEQGRPDKEVTLIEQEALEALHREYHLELDARETRRNLVTSGVALNHLVGVEFTVGTARFKGIRLCEPCGHLERLAGHDLKGLTHRGGLRAQVVQEGEILVGSPIVTVGPKPDRFSQEFLRIIEALGGPDCPGGAAR